MPDLTLMLHSHSHGVFLMMERGHARSIETCWQIVRSRICVIIWAQYISSCKFGWPRVRIGRGCLVERWSCRFVTWIGWCQSKLTGWRIASGRTLAEVQTEWSCWMCCYNRLRDGSRSRIKPRCQVLIWRGYGNGSQYYATIFCMNSVSQCPTLKASILHWAGRTVTTVAWIEASPEELVGTKTGKIGVLTVRRAASGWLCNPYHCLMLRLTWKSSSYHVRDPFDQDSRQKKLNLSFVDDLRPDIWNRCSSHKTWETVHESLLLICVSKFSRQFKLYRHETACMKLCSCKQQLLRSTRSISLEDCTFGKYRTCVVQEREMPCLVLQVPYCSPMMLCQRPVMP